ncbi:ABC transporter F family member 4-like [Corylus avellana]|uniref:ABC transporter F family member 4-like n=1 Tax=Corylus avellana TaxID=13451 RepID=UPI00286C7267|nr:ABC transporter F family member 4-like [Corylus avellana]
MVWGDLVPTEGEVRRSQKLRIRRYSQHYVDVLTMEETPSIDALANALDEFYGGVVLVSHVSHDSRLISCICEDEERSEIWVVENGTASTYPGTFEEYKEELQREIKQEVDD